MQLEKYDGVIRLITLEEHEAEALEGDGRDVERIWPIRDLHVLHQLVQNRLAATSNTYELLKTSGRLESHNGFAFALHGEVCTLGTLNTELSALRTEIWRNQLQDED